MSRRRTTTRTPVYVDQSRRNLKAEYSEPNSRTSSPGGFSVILKDSIAFVGLASAVFYGYLWLGYYQFYSYFGLVPEDTGLGRIELLSQALIGPVVMLSLGIPLLLILGVAIIIEILLVATISATLKSSHRSMHKVFVERGRSSRVYLKRHGMVLLRWSFAISIIISLVLFLFPWYERASEAGRAAVSEGKGSATYVRHLGSIEIPILQIRASPVDVNWKDNQKYSGNY